MKVVLDTNVLLVIFSSKSGYRWIFDCFLEIISPNEFKSLTKKDRRGS